MNVFRDPAENESIALATERAGSIDRVIPTVNLQYVPLQAGTSRDQDIIKQTIKTWEAYSHKAAAQV